MGRNGSRRHRGKAPATMTMLVVALVGAGCTTGQTDASHAIRSSVVAYVGNEAGIVPISSGLHARQLIPIHSRPGGRAVAVGPMAVSPSRLLGYSFASSPDGLLGIDLATGSTSRIGPAFPIDLRWIDIAMGPNARNVFAVFRRSDGDGAIVRIDSRSGQMSDPVAVSGVPVSLSISPKGNVAYVAVNGGGSVLFVDLASGRVVRTVQVPKGCSDLAVSPDGRMGYAVGTEVDSTGSGMVSHFTPIDLTTGAVAPPVESKLRLSDLVVSSDGKSGLAIADNSGGPTKSGRVWRIDLGDGVIVGWLAVQGCN